MTQSRWHVNRRKTTSQRKSSPQARLARLGWSSLAIQALLAFISGLLVGTQMINMTPYIRGEVLVIRLSLLIPFVMILLAVVQLITAWQPPPLCS